MLLAVVGSDAYKWWLAFHILLAVVWVGSDVAIQIFVIRARRAGPDRLAYLASEIEWYGTRVLLPTSLALVIIGFILLHVSAGAYDLGQGWVTFGFVVWLLSASAGAFYLGPESGRLSKMVEERGPEDPRIPAPAQPDLPRVPDRAPAADPGRTRHGGQAGTQLNASRAACSRSSATRSRWLSAR
jgi:uncharacterized membrane protein